MAISTGVRGTALIAALVAAIGIGPAHAASGTDEIRAEKHSYADPTLPVLGPGGLAGASANASLNGEVSVETHVSEFGDLPLPIDIDLPIPNQSTAFARAGLVRSFPLDAGGVYDASVTLVPTTAGVSMHSGSASLFAGVSASITAGLDVTFSCAEDACANVPLIRSGQTRVIACDSAGTCNNPGSVRITARIMIPTEASGTAQCFAWLQARATVRGIGTANAHGDTYVSQLELERV